MTKRWKKQIEAGFFFFFVGVGWGGGTQTEAKN